MNQSSAKYLAYSDIKPRRAANLHILDAGTRIFE